MTIPENVRDVAMKVTAALTPATLFVVVLFVLHDVVMMYTFSSLQLERIKAVMSIIETCTNALIKTKGS